MVFRIFAFFTCFRTSISQIQFRILYIVRFRTFAFSHFAFYTYPQRVAVGPRNGHFRPRNGHFISDHQVVSTAGHSVRAATMSMAGCRCCSSR